MSEPSGTVDGVKWTVTGQQQTTIINPAGQAINGWNVMFTLSNGTAGSVFVPNTAYNIDNVKAAIVAQADVMLGISGLTG